MSVEETFEQLQQLPNQVGVLVLDAEGAVLKASGELEEDQEPASKAIMKVLHDTRELLRASNTEEPLQQVTVNFEAETFVATVSKGIVYVVKKADDEEADS